MKRRPDGPTPADRRQSKKRRRGAALLHIYLIGTSIGHFMPAVVVSTSTGRPSVVGVVESNMVAQQPLIGNWPDRRTVSGWAPPRR
ncbi:hypothetical protein Q1695_014892 [Nippostrongylus brasiliensis]|nr:hypothetical protein Q1695_014892 [Nippostrongylus brasiliensis]